MMFFSVNVLAVTVTDGAVIVTVDVVSLVVALSEIVSVLFERNTGATTTEEVRTILTDGLIQAINISEKASLFLLFFGKSLSKRGRQY